MGSSSVLSVVSCAGAAAEGEGQGRALHRGRHAAGNLLTARRCGRGGKTWRAGAEGGCSGQRLLVG